MAGRNRSEKGRPNQRTTSRKQANKENFAKVLELRKYYDMPRPTGITMADVLQESLERVVGLMRLAGSKVDEVELEGFWEDTVAGKQPDKWFRLETALRREAVDIAARMMGLDIDARRVALAEAEAKLVERYIQAVLGKLELTPAQRRLIGPALREARAVIEGTAEEIAA